MFEKNTIHPGNVPKRNSLKPAAVKDTNLEPVVYSVREVSILLRTNPAYVYRLINLGLLPALKLSSIRVRKDALDSFLLQYEGHDLSNPDDIKSLVKAG